MKKNDPARPNEAILVKKEMAAEKKKAAELAALKPDGSLAATSEKPKTTKLKPPSKESFLAALQIKGNVDLVNYGKLVPATYKASIVLAREIDRAYEEYK